MKQKLGFVLLAVLLTGCMQAIQTYPAPTQTSGFTVEITATPLPSHTVTATFTELPTSTLTPTPANTATPTPTFTPIATCTDMLTKPVVAHLSSGVQVSVAAPFELTPYVQGGQLVIPDLQVFVDGVTVENPTVYFVASNPQRIYVLLTSGRPGQMVEVRIPHRDGAGLYCSGQIEISATVQPNATEKPGSNDNNNGDSSSGPSGGDGGGGDGGG
jgi:uncharacterized membrane protein YgcG